MRESELPDVPGPRYALVAEPPKDTDVYCLMCGGQIHQHYCVYAVAGYDSRTGKPTNIVLHNECRSRLDERFDNPGWWQSGQLRISEWPDGRERVTGWHASRTDQRDQGDEVGT